MLKVGHTFARVKIYSPINPSKTLDLNLIVDTGSTYTWIKRAKLEGLGLKPIGERLFRTIEGKVIRREIGEAYIECLGEKVTTIIVFAEEGDIEVLGVYALEGLGLEIDPTTKELRKSEAILALSSHPEGVNAFTPSLNHKIC
jgi:predicted aspartyl protease